ncbi:MAG: helix-turn-helix transcriptional regulator [Acidobacteriota bacterium]|nr:helix-turn-helix transcriptional regulator [Acidobacteriota bacterium]
MTLTECPVRRTIDVLDGKWKPLILFSLKGGKLRYAKLRTEVREPSEKVLIEQLRQLEDEGIIERRSYLEVPPRVEYSITPYGNTLMPLLQGMADWGSKHRERITLDE